MGNLNGYIIFRPEDEPTAGQILEHAAMFLENFGWRRNSLGGKKHTTGDEITYESACLVGAMNAVTRPLKKKGSRARASRLLRKVIGLPIMTYNDSHAKTEKEVIENLRKAAKLDG